MQQQKKSAAARPRRSRSVRLAPAGYTTSAMEYAQMLCDPCNSTLKPPLYPGSVGSNVMRFRAEHVIGNATSTACALAYHPVYGAFTLTADSGSVASTFTYNADATPGDAFLATSGSVQSTRGVAGCVQLAYPGTEFNRSGYVSMGVISGATIWNALASTSGGGGLPISPTDLLEILTHSQRMPVDEVECAWVPSFGDQEFSSLTVYTTANSLAIKENFEKANFVTFIVQGAQASSAGIIRVTNTGILEVNWKGGRGLVSNAAHVQTNPTTFTSVVAALQRKDPHWYINAAKKVARLVGTAAGGYASGGMLGMATSLMGLNIGRPAAKNVA